MKVSVNVTCKPFVCLTFIKVLSLEIGTYTYSPPPFLSLREESFSVILKFYLIEKSFCMLKEENSINYKEQNKSIYNTISETANT